MEEGWFGSVTDSCPRTWIDLLHGSKVSIDCLRIFLKSHVGFSSNRTRAESIMRFDWAYGLVQGVNREVVAAPLGFRYTGKKTKFGHSVLVAEQHDYATLCSEPETELNLARRIGYLSYAI